MKNLISEKLSLLNQAHLLKHIKDLNKNEQQELIEQLENLDFSVLNENVANEKRGFIEPLFATTLQEIEKNKEHYKKIGIDAIKAGKVGTVLLAGGQGSRLGFEKPKGMFNIGENRELFIFECLINNLLDVVRETGTWIPLFVMTSTQNNKDTRDFFEEHNYFGYDSSSVMFFVQEQLPTVNKDGKLMLVEKGVVSTAPNGNGGWYASMIKSGLLNVLKVKQIEWLNVFAVDNVLQKMADPCFIGAVIESGKDSGSKVVAKAAPEERVGVMCLEDGKPSIVEYYEMTDEMRYSREDDGNLSYNYGVILNYLFKTEKLNELINANLPLHKAFKKVPYYDETIDETVCPEEPNAYKYETLVLDMVKLQNSCLAYEVERNKEFAPVKNKTGVDSVDTARALLKENGIEL